MGGRLGALEGAPDEDSEEDNCEERAVGISAPVTFVESRENV